MENEKLTYINSRGERLELGVDSVYHCNISKDVEGISGVTSVIYSTNSMGQHGDTYVGQRIEARDIDVVGHINTRDNNGANCGARAVNCNNYPWNVNTNIGARGACDLVRTLQAQSSTEYWQGLRKG